MASSPAPRDSSDAAASVDLNAPADLAGAGTPAAQLRRARVLLPLLIGLAAAVGVLAGASFTGPTSFSNPRATTRGYYKFRDVLSYIDRDYVDSVNTEELAEYAVQQMLERLDPHSVYIPARDLELANSYLEGDFEGVGIEFNLFDDTISVVTPIAGGPAAGVGIQTGDQILAVDHVNLAGVRVSNDQVFSRLRGPKGSKTVLTVRRAGEPELINFLVQRARIASTSVEVAYMLDSRTGYLKVNRFARNTYAEFRGALGRLRRRGLRRLILDLRGNPGGYVDQATAMADEFLAGERRIVYTDGKGDRYDVETLADETGVFEQGPLVVLLDEGSASASEIVAGALQDHDRALIVGRRSFGKGLVQQVIALPDGSELRLTTARYYTPSGRCIQKQYKGVRADEYDNDVANRYRTGEEFRPDSSRQDRAHPYKTLVRGRTVYGGGGIAPDVFVPRDTSETSDYLEDLFAANLPREFSLRYCHNHRKDLRRQGWPDFRDNFRVTDKMLQTLVSEATAVHIPYDKKGLARARPLLVNYLKAAIARTAYGVEASYRVAQEKDVELQAALRHFDQATQLASGR